LIFELELRMISINRRFINFPVSQLVLLFILFSLMIIVMIRQFWWKPLEREIKFLEKKISSNQSELNNLLPERFSKDLIQYETSPESPAKSLQALQESNKNFEIQILQQKLNSINDSRKNDGFEIILSLKATYQNLTKWLERLDSQKNILHIPRINVKYLDTSEISPKIQLDLTVNGFQIPEK
tara:strand:+ start:2522 stop:3070 length:549 start_codon:yes stop_codon:yes gene_type:complete